MSRQHLEGKNNNDTIYIEMANLCNSSRLGFCVSIFNDYGSFEKIKN